MSTLDIVKWTLSSMAAGIAMIISAQGLFDTRSEAMTRHHALQEEIDKASSSIERRLERIESKLDRIRK